MSKLDLMPAHRKHDLTYNQVHQVRLFFFPESPAKSGWFWERFRTDLFAA